MIIEEIIINIIVNIRDAKDILSYCTLLKEDAVIFCDIDDTIITPKSKTFRLPPYNKLIDNIKKNKAKYLNYEEIISNWRLQRKAILTDNSWPFILSQLQKKFLTFGLTKMDKGKFGNIESMEVWRYNELQSFNIKFSNSDKFCQQNKNESVFYKGILITGKNSKSQAISEFLPLLKTKHIVLVDDRIDYLVDVQQFCKNNQINFIGMMFYGTKILQEKPDPRVAIFQQKHLIKSAQWLEDDEAEYYIKKGKNVSTLHNGQ